MIVKHLKLSQGFDGTLNLSLELTNKNDIKVLETLTDEAILLDLTLKKHRKKKTLTQLGSLHVLCNEIAKKLHSTKLEIYQHAVREVGEFILVPVANDEVDKWIKNWCLNSESAQCVELRDSKLEGYKTLQCYYSVATYDTKDMSVLIDYVVDEAAEQEVYLMTKEEIKEMKGNV